MKANKTVKFAMLAAVFAALMLASLIVQPASSQAPLPTIVIRPDGSISPDSVAITRNGDTYTFTGNIYATMKIQRSNIILDGAGYALYGSYNGTAMDVWLLGEGPDQLPKGVLAQYTIGIDLAMNVEGITIQNLDLKNFSIGTYIWTKNNTFTANRVSENIVGILLSGSNSTVTGNYIANNRRGLFFGFNNEAELIPSDIIIHHNHFQNNEVQLNGCLCKDFNTSEPPHSWDSGREGNFWSDYNGTDADGDGIGDTAYVIDLLNQDRYPLINSPINPPTVKQQTTFPIELVLFAVALVIAALAVLLIYRLKFRKATKP